MDPLQIPFLGTQTYTDGTSSQNKFLRSKENGSQKKLHNGGGKWLIVVFNFVYYFNDDIVIVVVIGIRIELILFHMLKVNSIFLDCLHTL